MQVEQPRRIFCVHGFDGPHFTKMLEYYYECNVFEQVGNPFRRDEMSLNPQVTLHEFDK